MLSALPDKFSDRLSLRVAAFRSWSSMKTPVMVWLWYLNVIYWVAFYYLPRPEALWAVVSYLAIAPFVSAMIRMQRGLTRLSGLIHIPWVPFVVYLGLRLFTDVLGASLSFDIDGNYYVWLQIVFWSTLICLILDVVDVFRWLSGERYVLGTPAAHAARASKLKEIG